MSASSASKGTKPVKNASSAATKDVMDVRGEAKRGRPPAAPQPGETQPARASAGRPSSKAPANKGLVRPAPRAKVRRARLVVSKVDTWSVLKLAFLLSVALGIITVVASLVLWLVLSLTGLFDGINEMLAMLGGSAGETNIKEFLSVGNVALFATVISVANVILLTALSVLAALLYNIASALIGGIGMTLTDD